MWTVRVPCICIDTPLLLQRLVESLPEILWLFAIFAGLMAFGLHLFVVVLLALDYLTGEKPKRKNDEL